MPKKTISREEIVKRLLARKGDRTISALAAEFGVTKAYMGQVISGLQAPGPAILEPLRIQAEKQTIYRERLHKRAAILTRLQKIMKRLPYKQDVGGSSPSLPTNTTNEAVKHQPLAPLLLALTLSASAQDNTYFGNWPSGVSPQEVGKRVAEHFVVSPHQYTATIHYSEVATWYGALTFASLTHDDGLRRVDPQVRTAHARGRGSGSYSGAAPRLDDSIFGVVPLEIAQTETKDPKRCYWKGLGGSAVENPHPDGLSAETRFWIDDMYMLTLLQLEAYRATGDRKYLDRDALEMAAYLDKLQQPNGLFFTRRTCPFIGDVETAGSLPAWRRCCGICPRTTRNASASWKATAP